MFAEGGSLWRVPATGGDMELVTEGSVDAAAYYRPEFLPGGETVLGTTLGPYQIVHE